MAVRASLASLSDVRTMRAKLARNIAFAIRATLKEAAEETREDIKDGLHLYFTIRNQYSKGGIRATTYGAVGDPNLHAKIGVIKPKDNPAYLDKHALGGERNVRHKVKPMKGAHGDINVDVGSGIPIGARPQKQVWTSKGRWPGAYAKRDGSGVTTRARVLPGGVTGNVQVARKTNRTFVTVIKGRKYLVTRKARGTKATLKFWYFFSEAKNPRIKHDWPFEQYKDNARRWFMGIFPKKMKENL